MWLKYTLNISVFRITANKDYSTIRFDYFTIQIVVWLQTSGAWIKITITYMIGFNKDQY